MDRLQLEIDYWKNSPHEKPGPLTLPNIANKVSDAGRFLLLFQAYRPLFKGRVLELGAGQGWASCLVKKLTEAQVIATDISPHAIEGVKEWETFWGVNLYDTYACQSHETREASSSVDLVFCYASAHHFGDQGATLAEIKRILKPDGVAIYFNEPTVSRLLYRVQIWRMNRLRPAVQEDAIVPSRLNALAERVGLKARFDYVKPKGWISKPANIVLSI